MPCKGLRCLSSVCLSSVTNCTYHALKVFCSLLLSTHFTITFAGKDWSIQIYNATLRQTHFNFFHAWAHLQLAAGMETWSLYKYCNKNQCLAVATKKSVFPPWPIRNHNMWPGLRKQGMWAHKIWLLIETFLTHTFLWWYAMAMKFSSHL